MCVGVFIYTNTFYTGTFYPCHALINNCAIIYLYVCMAVSIVPNYASISCSSPTSSRDFNDIPNSFENQKEAHGKSQVRACCLSYTSHIYMQSSLTYIHSPAVPGQGISSAVVVVSLQPDSDQQLLCHCAAHGDHRLEQVLCYSLLNTNWFEIAAGRCSLSCGGSSDSVLWW